MTSVSVFVLHCWGAPYAHQNLGMGGTGGTLPLGNQSAFYQFCASSDTGGWSWRDITLCSCTDFVGALYVTRQSEHHPTWISAAVVLCPLFSCQNSVWHKRVDGFIVLHFLVPEIRSKISSNHYPETVKKGTTTKEDTRKTPDRPCTVDVSLRFWSCFASITKMTSTHLHQPHPACLLWFCEASLLVSK